MAMTDNVDQTNRLGAKLVWYIFVFWDFLVLTLFSIKVYFIEFFKLFFPPPPKSLKGERILITGSGNGIGREVCLQLAQSGATLIGWDIDEAANNELLQDLTDLGAKAYVYVVDISDRSTVEATAAKVKKDVGNVTIVINNAAIMPAHSFLGHNPRELERVFQINVFGQFWILREFLPSMLKNNKGHIVTVCSAAGIIGTRNMVPYVGTKHAVHGYLEALKDELRHMPEKPRINFTTVYPCSVNTALTGGVNCFTKFPSLLPVLEPEYVARELIDAMRRNYEYIYLPKLVKLCGVYGKSLPMEVQRAATDFLQVYVEPIQ
ncbi:unnamed protein product [Allacma fusca]|uniref:Short-chain dehydrogenase/reductase 3 n=1 Tax=Allacma fusca TaxID=39272 RepID=A0A8J2LM27_9HEXA|nr:unnamed protein product [Allacma fusca]